MKRRHQFIILLCCLLAISSAKTQDCTDVARDDESLLVLSTLGGGLTAIDIYTNEIRWTIDDEPIDRPDLSSEGGMPLPQYLPDPRDGSLYQLGDMGGIKKMPYTIPELVASAPCRSSDGILYSGRKSDTWFLVDPKTGQKERIFDITSSENKFNSRSVYLGRTQYNVLMYDSLSKGSKIHSWNVTFFDYSAHTMSPDLSREYEWLHLTGSSTGNVVTLNRKTGKLLWQRSLSSPVVGVFILTSDGLLSVPFTPVSESTLENVIEYSRNGNQNDLRLYQSLYVGENKLGLYAIPSLTDKSTPIITSNTLKLLTGPDNEGKRFDGQFSQATNNNKNDNSFILLGYYEMPKVDDQEAKLILGPSSPSNKDMMTIDSTLPAAYQPHQTHKNNIIYTGESTQDSSFRVTLDQIMQFQVKDKTDASQQTDAVSSPHRSFYKWLNQTGQDKWFELGVLILFGMMLFLFFLFFSLRHEIRQQSKNGSHVGEKGSNSTGSNSGDYSPLEELDSGETKVGKITFHSDQLLGKGCEGTFVFRGKFENRDVAVKRLLPDCFTLADREVALLRESDSHENVVRYFCTENDRQFKYIALELCSATLQDYVEGSQSKTLQKQIDVKILLKQATNGLAHLHTLNIVHRDIKPQNVLVSFPDVNGRVRVMISDFGLCKKLSVGKASFSKRSGVTGTDGWIASEMVAGRRTTTSVDIFSMGCVFYYVLTKGCHPFGDPMKRQANILGNEFSLCKISDSVTHVNVLAEELIQDMINVDAGQRPSARAILNHPLFWSSERILSFLQDVSDRVEKALPSLDPLKTLEKNAQLIVKDDWSLQLESEITNDLRKFRGYQGGSVRDLLRALRNKKHHYHELDEAIQNIMGNIPHNFTSYWINKFPRLLSHSYHALELCSTEPSFSHYYPSSYTFKKPEYFYADEEEDAENNWRRFVQKGSGAAGDQGAPSGDQLNWRQTSTSQASPAKKNKKGAYNFRRINEEPEGSPNGGIGGGGAKTAVAKQRKFYPRKDPKKDQWAKDGVVAQ